MLFNSHEFFIFLPIVWGLWALLRRFGFFQTALGVLVTGSFVFYGFGDWRLCLLLGVSIVVNYLLHRCMLREGTKRIFRSGLLWLGILFNLGLLFYFKYLDFSIENLNRMFHMSLALRRVVLPLGISFYTFQQLSFVIDSYHRRMKSYSFLEYSVFVSFFPQLVAGPIVLHQEFIPQLREKKTVVSSEHIVKGMEYFAIGLAKKILIADRFAGLVNAGYANVYGLNGTDAILVILGYTLQIYFDFSGYCDMAMGLGYIFGIHLPVNFDSPYKAKNISDFWKRWHMTLTRFFTTYLYIPLGGNRKGRLRTCMNVLLVFAVSGLWHGAAWTFVLWGMMHGIALVCWHLFGKWLSKLPDRINWLFTFVFVNFAWCFFRADYLTQPLDLLKQVVVRPFSGVSLQLAGILCEDSFLWETLKRVLSESVFIRCGQGMAYIWFVLWILICVKAPSSHQIVEKGKRTVGRSMLLGLIFALAVLKMSQVSEFIYFHF